LSHALGERIANAFRAATRRERKLRIGIDIRPFYEPLTGIGWYLYHLLHELAKHEDVELYLFGDARVTDFGPTLQADIPANARLCWFDLRGQGIISGRARAITAAAICVSESTRQDLLAFYDLDPSRAVTILSGISISDSRLPTPDTLPKNYILFVSTIEPRKNLEVLLDAFARLRARGAYAGALVVVGRVGWKSESIIPRLHAPGVHHVDYVPPPQLASIYR